MSVSWQLYFGFGYRLLFHFWVFVCVRVYTVCLLFLKLWAEIMYRYNTRTGLLLPRRWYTITLVSFFFCLHPPFLDNHIFLLIFSNYSLCIGFVFHRQPSPLSFLSLLAATPTSLHALPHFLDQLIHPTPTSLSPIWSFWPIYHFQCAILLSLISPFISNTVSFTPPCYLSEGHAV